MQSKCNFTREIRILFNLLLIHIVPKGAAVKGLILLCSSIEQGYNYVLKLSGLKRLFKDVRQLSI